MNTRHLRLLSLVYLERARSALIAVTLSMTPVCILFAKKSGYQPAELALNFTVLAALYPFAIGGVVAKSKADGSLAFLASLPISASDHARSWLLVITLLSLPIALVVMLACHYPPLALRGTMLAAVGLMSMVCTISAVMGMLAVQLSAPPAMAGARFMSVLCGLILLLAAVGKLHELQPSALDTLVRSPYFFPVLSLMGWSAAAAGLWWSWQRIGHFMTSYVGDPPSA